MATIIDVSQLTLNPEESMDVSKHVYERVFERSSLNEVHQIWEGITHRMKIPFFGLMDDVGQCVAGCAPPASEGSIPMSEKEFNPVAVGFRLEHCTKDLNPLFKYLKKKGFGLESYDLENSDEILSFILSRAGDALERMIWRYVWFGDTAIQNQADTGVLKNGVNVNKFNCLDGLWKQIFDAVTAGDITRVTITENAAASKTAQLDLAGTATYDYFKAMYEAADTRLLSDPNAQFFVTRGMLLNWQTYLEGKDGCCTLDRLEDGTLVYKFRGIPIKVVDEWDRIIKAFFDQGATYDIPNRAILTVRENLPIGTEDEEHLKLIKSYYWEKDRVNYIEAETGLDTKVLEDYMITAAY